MYKRDKEKTNFPHGLNTSEIKANLAVAEKGEFQDFTTAGEAYKRKVAEVNVTNDTTLAATAKHADTIVITVAGTSKALTLGMEAGKVVLILNGGAKSVTIKNKAADTGATATTAKMALFYIHALDVVKLTADVDIPVAG